MNRVYSQANRGNAWLRRYVGHRPRLACVLGFTNTALISGISAAGASPEDRKYTAIADAEFLYRGPTRTPRYPLPPLTSGVSPVLISRAVISAQRISLQLFNAGLPVAPTVPHIDLRGIPADCVSTGRAMPVDRVDALFRLGIQWGHRLGSEANSAYVILGECVVGGTTTALALLTGLGFSVDGKISSSHVVCNHHQKYKIAQQGLAAWSNARNSDQSIDPLDLVAAIGDPMQVAVAGMAIAASFHGGVMLAGGTQMLAVYALARALARRQRIPWQAERIVVGTTRWVAEDPAADAVGIAELIGDVPLIASQLSFRESRYGPLRQYEAGYVKEGVAAGGCAIAAALYQNWQQPQLLQAIEMLYEKFLDQRKTSPAAITSDA